GQDPAHPAGHRAPQPKVRSSVMKRSLGRTWALAGPTAAMGAALVAALIATVPMQAVAGGKGGGMHGERVPTFSTGMIVKIHDDVALPPELLAKAKALAAKHGINLSHLRKLARGGDVIEFDRPLPHSVLRVIAAELAKLDARVDYVEPDVVMVPMGL